LTSEQGPANDSGGGVQNARWRNKRTADKIKKVAASAILLGAFASYATAQNADPQVLQPETPQQVKAEAQKPDNNATAGELAKAVQNPVASLISVPIQNNSNLGIGSYNRTQDVLNIQPVIPLNLGSNWNLITRTIQPIVWQPYPAATTGGQYGLGDMNPSFFLSPAKPGKVIWGAGPTFVIPTATNSILGQGKLSTGPSALALVQPGPWTVGALVNNVWSVAGSGGRPVVNQMLLQYFVNYNMKKGWYISISPILTANWRASAGNVWTVPVGGGIGKIAKLGYQPVNLSVAAYGNAASPSGSSSWSVRVQIAFLFPKLTKAQQIMMMQQKMKQLQQTP
jgi:hypothetical protein